MKIVHASKFERSFKKLTIFLVEKTIERTIIFEKNPFDPRLDTHKLHGKLKTKWSFLVDGKNRVLFEFDKKDVIFLDVGDHNLYR